MDNHIFDLYEADINPICRFTDHSGVKGCGWVKIKDYTVPRTNFTKCAIDIETSWKNIKPIDRDIILEEAKSKKLIIYAQKYLPLIMFIFIATKEFWFAFIGLSYFIFFNMYYYFSSKRKYDFLRFN